MQGLWPALKGLGGSTEAAEPAETAEVVPSAVAGVPRAPPCRVELDWLDQPAAARCTLLQCFIQAAQMRWALLPPF